MTSKLTLMVCPHDTAKKPERWFRFVQYLNHHLAVGVHLEISLDFNDFRRHLDAADIVYANPADTIQLVKHKGFSCLVRPKNLYDEVVFIAHPDIPNPTLESLQSATIATVNSMLPTKVALQSLKKHGIEPAILRDNASWLGVVNSVAKNDAAFGIVYKDTFDELSQKSKEMVNAFATSDEKVLFHSINISPNAIAYQNEFDRILLEMDADPVGKDVLQELHIEQWCKTKQDEIDAIEHFLCL